MPSRVVRRRVPLRLAAQRGFTIVEMVIALVVMTVVVTLAGGQLAGKVQDAAAESLGKYLLTVKGGMDNMLAANFMQLRDGGTALTGVYANPLAPTLAELRTAGHLSAGFPAVAPFNKRVLIRITRSAGCPDDACRIDAIAYIDSALQTGASQPRDDLAAQAVMASGGFGGASYSGNPGTLRGVTFSVPNPLGSVAGIVAVSLNMDTTMFNQFVRMRDERNPDLQGELSVKGKIASKEGIEVTNAAGDTCMEVTDNGVLTLNCNGRIVARNASLNDGTTEYLTINQNGMNLQRQLHAAEGVDTRSGSIFNLGSDAIESKSNRLELRTLSGQALTVADTREVQVNSTLSLGSLNTAGAYCDEHSNGLRFSRDGNGSLLACVTSRWVALAQVGRYSAFCSSPGAYATDAGTGRGMLCRSNIWTWVDDALGSFVLVQSMLVGHGTLIPKPFCGPQNNGTPLIYLIPSVESSRGAAFTRRATDLGSMWQVQLLDYDGQPLGGPAVALAHIYCRF